MTFTKSVTSIVPGMMSLSLVGYSAQTIPKNWSPKGVKKISPKDMVGNFTGIMIGVPLIGVVSGMVSGL